MLQDYFGAVFVREDLGYGVVRFVLEDYVLVLDVVELYTRGVVKKDQEVLGQGELHNRPVIFQGEPLILLLLAINLMQHHLAIIRQQRHIPIIQHEPLDAKIIIPFRHLLAPLQQRPLPHPLIVFYCVAHLRS